MAQVRVRPRTRETVLKDQHGRVVPYDNEDGTQGILVEENDPFWLRRIRDKDAVTVPDAAPKKAVPKGE